MAGIQIDRLPLLPLLNILQQMDFFELFVLSFTGKHGRSIIQLLRNKLPMPLEIEKWEKTLSFFLGVYPNSLIFEIRKTTPEVAQEPTSEVVQKTTYNFAGFPMETSLDGRNMKCYCADKKRAMKSLIAHFIVTFPWLKISLDCIRIPNKQLKLILEVLEDHKSAAIKKIQVKTGKIRGHLFKRLLEVGKNAEEWVFSRSEQAGSKAKGLARIKSLLQLLGSSSLSLYDEFEKINQDLNVFIKKWMESGARSEVRIHRLEGINRKEVFDGIPIWEYDANFITSTYFRIQGEDGLMACIFLGHGGELLMPIR